MSIRPDSPIRSPWIWVAALLIGVANIAVHQIDLREFICAAAVCCGYIGGRLASPRSPGETS